MESTSRATLPTPEPTPHVEDLARRAAGGDTAALDTLLATVRPEALRMCARFLPNREDAEEACQDTLMALARGITRFEGRSTFRTWLYRLAANRARSTYQRLRRESRTAGVALVPDRPDPRRTSVIAGTRLDLLDALERLRPEFAEAVALRDVLGLSYGEIADLQQVPEGTVKSRIHQARQQLRERLDAGGR
jgi:RNA polymerase sigma-70 factor (ECF subfamily)